MILITGGAGYIGSHINLCLTEAGYKTVVLDDLSTGHQWAVPQGGVFVHGSVGNKALLSQIFGKYSIKAVVHCAASMVVSESVANPSLYYENNVAGTLALLAVMREHKVKRLLFSSTAAVYGEPLESPIREDHPLQALNPYGRTKVILEWMLRDYSMAYGLQYLTFRYFNACGAHPSALIGEAHSPETHLIPLVLDVALGRRPSIAICGADYPTTDGTAIRDYVHVCDIAEAHRLGLDRLLQSEPYPGRHIINGTDSVFNLGSTRGSSVLQVIEACRQVTGHPIPATEAPRRHGDPAILVASAQKAQEDLGWQPTWHDLKSMIATAWRWHQQQN